MTVASRTALGVVAVAAVAALALAASGGSAPDEGPHKHVRTIETSYAFDLTNLRELTGYADNVFVGRVVARAGSTQLRTQSVVEVVETLEGDLSGRVVVDQLGYETAREIHVAEGQSLLRPGATYLIVSNDAIDGSGWQTLMGGPASLVRVDASNRAGVERTYRRALARATWPASVPRD